MTVFFHKNDRVFGKLLVSIQKHRSPSRCRADSPSAKALIWRRVRPANLDRVLVNHILVRFREAALIVDVPAEAFAERIDELAADLGLVVTGERYASALRSNCSTRRVMSLGAGIADPSCKRRR